MATSIHITGGGVRGVFSASCIDSLQKHGGAWLDNVHHVSGVSAGSIVAACIASEKDLAHTVDLLQNKTIVEPRSTCSSLMHAFGLWKHGTAYYDNEGLMEALQDITADARCEVPELIIGVTNNTTMRQELRRLRRGQRIDPREIVASCSIPALFPPVRLGDADYIDGGVFSLFARDAVMKDMDDGHTRVTLLMCSQPWQNRQDPHGQSSLRSVLTRFATELLWSQRRHCVEQYLNKLDVHMDDLPPRFAILCPSREVVLPGGGMPSAPWDKAVIFCSPSEDQFARWSATNLTMAPGARAPGIRRMIDGGQEAAMDVQRLLLQCGIRDIDVSA